MTRKRSFPRALGSIVLAAVVVCQPGYAPLRAHWDAPGPPPIQVKMTVLDVKLVTPQDDGADGDAEMLLYLEFEHLGHSFIMATAFDKDDVVGTAWPIAANIWTHDECSPRQPILVNTVLTELDCGSREVLLAGLSSVGRIGLAALFGGPVTIAHDPLRVINFEIGVFGDATYEVAEVSVSDQEIIRRLQHAREWALARGAVE